MEAGGHHRKRPLQPFARQLGKAAPIGKARRVNNPVDLPEGFTRRADKARACSKLCKVSGGNPHPCPLPLAFGSDVLQTGNPRRIAALPVQYQTGFRAGQTARRRSADSGPSPRDDRNPQNPPLTPAATIGPAAWNANDRHLPSLPTKGRAGRSAHGRTAPAGSVKLSCAFDYKSESLGTPATLAGLLDASRLTRRFP